MPRKADPKKQGSSIRIHKPSADLLTKAMAKYIGQTGKVISLTDFIDIVITRGITALKL